MKNPKRIFISRIKTLRRLNGWSQSRLAQASGLSREYLARLELGHQDPTLGTMAKLAKALKVGVVDLLSNPLPKGRVRHGTTR